MSLKDLSDLIYSPFANLKIAFGQFEVMEKPIYVLMCGCIYGISVFKECVILETSKNRL